MIHVLSLLNIEIQVEAPSPSLPLSPSLSLHETKKNPSKH